MIIEKYTNRKGEAWIRIIFNKVRRTKVVMSEKEFEKKYGKVD